MYLIDLVIRKFSNLICKKNLTTNLIGLLFQHFTKNIDDLLDFLIKLAQSNYLYVYNNILLLKIIPEVISNYKIVGSKTAYEKFEKMISAHHFPNRHLIYMNRFYLM